MIGRWQLFIGFEDLPSAIFSRSTLDSLSRTSLANLSQSRRTNCGRLTFAPTFVLRRSIRIVAAVLAISNTSSKSASRQPNYSFKPRPLRGSAYAVTCTTPPAAQRSGLTQVLGHGSNSSFCVSRQPDRSRISRHLWHLMVSGLGFGHIGHCSYLKHRW